MCNWYTTNPSQKCCPKQNTSRLYLGVVPGSANGSVSCRPYSFRLTLDLIWLPSWWCWMSQAPRAEMCKSASKIIIYHIWRLRPFWSSFPNQPLWDLVPRCEEWFLSRQHPSLCWMCPSFLFLTCKNLIKQHCSTPKTAHKTTERAPTGKSGEYFLLHISLILPYMCKCVTVCACVCGGQRQPRVSFFWSLLPWCFWGRVSHWDLGPTDQAKLAGQKPLLLSTGIIYDWPLTLKNKQ